MPTPNGTPNFESVTANTFAGDGSALEVTVGGNAKALSSWLSDGTASPGVLDDLQDGLLVALGTTPLLTTARNAPFADIWRDSDSATVTFNFKDGAFSTENLALFGAGTRTRLAQWHNQVPGSALQAVADIEQDGPLIDLRQTINGVPSVLFDSQGLDNEAGSSGANRFLTIAGLSIPGDNFGIYHVSRAFNCIGLENFWDMNVSGAGGTDVAMGGGPYQNGHGSNLSIAQPLSPQVISARATPDNGGTLTAEYTGVRVGLQSAPVVGTDGRLLTYNTLVLGEASNAVANGANGGSSYDSFLIYSPAPTDEQHAKIVAALTKTAALNASTAIYPINFITCGDSWMQSWHSQAGLIWPYRIAQGLPTARVVNFGFFQALTAINNFQNIADAHDPNSPVNVILFDDGINDLDGETGAGVYYDTVFARQKQLVDMAHSAGFKCAFNTSFFEGGNSGGGKQTTEVSNHNKMLRANAIGADYICDIASDPIVGPIGVIQGNSAHSSDGSHLRQADYDRVAKNIVVPAAKALVAGTAWVPQGTPNCIGLDNPDGYYEADGTMAIAGYYLGAVPSGISAQLGDTQRVKTDAAISDFTASANRWTAKVVAGADATKILIVTSLDDATATATSDGFNVASISTRPPGAVETVILSTGATSWTAPANMDKVISIEGWGAGGAGYDGGGGGGAWAIRKDTTILAGVKANDTLSVVVGVSGDPSMWGGDSSVSQGSTVLMLSKGGEGAYTARIQSAGGEPNASAAQGGQASACIGDLAYSGGDGGQGSDTSFFWAGGGASASPSGAGEGGHASPQSVQGSDGAGGSSPDAGAGGAASQPGENNVNGGGGSGWANPDISVDSAAGGIPGGASGGASSANGKPGDGQVRIIYMLEPA